MYLNWRTLETQADAAALAAVLELDGTGAGLLRAKAVVEQAGREAGCAASLEFYSEVTGGWLAEGDAGSAKVRVRLARPAALGWVRFAAKDAPREVRAAATAEQRPADPPQTAQTAYSIKAVRADAADFGFRLGEKYEIAARRADKDEPYAPAAGKLVAVRVLSGPPKDREIGWAAFQWQGGQSLEATFAGAYLQGSKRTGARPAGYYVAALVQ